MPNATALKFGHPQALVAETAHWWVLTRPRQVTLGSLVLVCKQTVTAFGDVSAAGFTDLHTVIARAEKVLQGFVAYERINYLMLMMVDPDVHFHVIPRYRTAREYAGLDLPDASWPNPPNLGAAIELAPAVLSALTADLKARWAAA